LAEGVPLSETGCARLEELSTAAACIARAFGRGRGGVAPNPDWALRGGRSRAGGSRAIATDGAALQPRGAAHRAHRQTNARMAWGGRCRAMAGRRGRLRAGRADAGGITAAILPGVKRREGGTCRANRLRAHALESGGKWVSGAGCPGGQRRPGCPGDGECPEVLWASPRTGSSEKWRPPPSTASGFSRRPRRTPAPGSRRSTQR